MSYVTIPGYSGSIVIASYFLKGLLFEKQELVYLLDRSFIIFEKQNKCSNLDKPLKKSNVLSVKINNRGWSFMNESWSNSWTPTRVKKVDCKEFIIRFVEYSGKRHVPKFGVAIQTKFTGKILSKNPWLNNLPIVNLRQLPKP